MRQIPARDTSSPRSSPPSLRARPPRLIQRRRSSIHGTGVYARVAIAAGTSVIEYRGERITKAESARREARRLSRLQRGLPCSTFIFYLNKRHDLDGRRGGNISRFINHSCDPNCRAEQVRGRIWIVARRDIAAGEEISFDYGFPLAIWADNPCRCGARRCPGYIVAATQRWRLKKLVRDPSSGVPAGVLPAAGADAAGARARQCA